VKRLVRWLPLLLILLALPFLLGAGSCSWPPAPQPTPSPTATPEPTPTPEPDPSPVCPPAGATCGCWHRPPGEPWQQLPPCPTPAPTPTPTPTPAPTPPPTGTACPKALEPGAYVYLKDKRYGNGLDSTVFVHGDPELCWLIHSVAVNDCHLEGWAKRAECEIELAGGCPVWQYSLDGSNARARCLQARHDEASCDHWGDPVDRDDPQTPDVFEGRPVECGNQRDPAGDPMAGFFVIGHGAAYFRACLPDLTGCGPWVPGKDKP